MNEQAEKTLEEIRYREDLIKRVMAKVSYYQALKGVKDPETAKAIGITRQMFSLYRKGGSFPTIERLYKLSEFLGCATEDLLRKEF